MKHNWIVTNEWEASERFTSDDTISIYVRGRDGATITIASVEPYMLEHDDNLTGEHQMGAANLIARAPSMYGTLIELRETIPWDNYEGDEDIMALREAVENLTRDL
jgi:hypothetical protein